MSNQSSVKKLRSFQRTLQPVIKLDDQAWSYNVSGLPNSAELSRQGLVKSISVVSNDERQCITLKLEQVPQNRVTSVEPLDHFILISFADFRIRCPSKTNPNVTEAGSARQSADYIIRLLQTGVNINRVHYYFYGHSNSQLKSRSCFLLAESVEEISRKVEQMGDFSKIKTVAKKAKRIGLLFSSAVMGVPLPPERCEDIPDVQSADYIFTDGCGLIAPQLAKQLVKQVNITYRNKKYMPSVFQIRYRGYKGILTYEPSMHGKILAKFRDSMRKFKGAVDHDLYVVEYSKVT